MASSSEDSVYDNDNEPKPSTTTPIAYKPSEEESSEEKGEKGEKATNKSAFQASELSIPQAPLQQSPTASGMSESKQQSNEDASQQENTTDSGDHDSHASHNIPVQGDESNTHMAIPGYSYVVSFMCFAPFVCLGIFLLVEEK